MTFSPVLTFNDGNTIPQLGYGVWQVEDDVAEKVVAQAFEAGFRHIDTAKIYGNEAGVGRAIERSGLTPGEIFITTKLWNADQGYESTLKAFEDSMERLGLEDPGHVPDPLDAAQAGQVRGHLEGSHRAAEAGPRQDHWRLQLHQGRPAAPDRRDRRRAGHQPDRTAPLLQPGRAARIQRLQGHPHPGVVAARPGRRAAGELDHRPDRGQAQRHSRRRSSSRGTWPSATLSSPSP